MERPNKYLYPYAPIRHPINVGFLNTLLMFWLNQNQNQDKQLWLPIWKKNKQIELWDHVKVSNSYTEAKKLFQQNLKEERKATK
jgi:hypothetical protein